MPSVEDWVNSPLDIIQRLFDADRENHDNKVKEYFSKQLQDRDSLNWVPSLNDVPLHNLKTNTLVRFRCMVQDMYDPEFYLGVYESKDKNTGTTQLRSGKFKDLADCGMQQTVIVDSTKNVTMDRQTLYCVPIPAETNWVKSMYAESSRVNVQPSGHKSKSQKRPFDDDQTTSMETDDVDTAQKKTSSEMTSLENGHAAVKSELESEKGKASGMKNTDLNFPLPGEKGPACIVKVYDLDISLKLNETVEFVGILSNDPAMASFPQESGDAQNVMDARTMDEFDNDANSPPPSLVPRLHAVAINRLSHNNPLLPLDVEAGVESNPDIKGFLSEVKSLRDEIMAIFERIMLGDKLTAEFLLCHILSNVYARQDVVALGKFTLNISKCSNPSYSSLLADLLKELVSKVYLLPMSLTNMNTYSFLPRKDYVANRLTTGILQLTERTHLIVDETALQPGQLETKGVANITALGNVINWQKLEYDFNFHKQDFVTNIITLVISEGKSILKCDCQVPLVPSENHGALDEVFRTIHTCLSPSLLVKLRTYIGLMQLLPYSLPEGMQKTIEQDFVEARKENADNMSVDDFHRLLVLARLVSLSHGQTSLSLDLWEKTKLMEAQRKQRLPKSTSEASN